MRKTFSANFLLAFFVLSFHCLSFAEDPARGASSPTYSLAAASGFPIVLQKEVLPFPESKNMGADNTPVGKMPIEAIASRTPAARSQKENPAPLTAADDPFNKDGFFFDYGRLWKDKSTYALGKINLAGNNLDSLMNFIPCLSVAKFKVENSLFWNLEGYKESDLFKFLAIIFELKLNF